jgi:acetyl-CoA carboxylase biotin carboxyl carrier protein
MTSLARELEQVTGSGLPERSVRALCDEAVAVAGRLPGALRRLTLRSGDSSIEVEWPAETVPTTVPVTLSGAVSGVVAAQVPVEPATDVYEVRSPLVGTFYAASRPGAAPFVRVGDEVDAGDTLAIVEAMKLMNPITAERAGRVVEVCAGDGTPVEFDEPLVRIAPRQDQGD